jgi:hypothetical protein
MTHWRSTAVHVWWFVLYLGIVGWLSHGSWSLGFVSDDWSLLRSASTASSPWELLRPRPQNDAYAFHYIPLTELLFWSLHRLWGLSAVPWRLLIVFLQAVNAFLVARVARVCFHCDALTSWAAGAFFAVSFLHYEVQFWIVCSGGYLLTTSLFLLGLLYFAAWLRSNNAWRYCAYALCSLGAVLSNEAALCIVLVAAWLEYAILGVRQGLIARMRAALFHQLGLLAIFGLHMWWRSASRSGVHADATLRDMVGAGYCALFQLLSFNVAALYEWAFAHMAIAAVATSILGIAILIIADRRLAVVGGCFVLAYSPYVPFAGVEARYSYLPACFSAVAFGLLSCWVASRIGGHRTLVGGAWIIVTLGLNTPYREGRLREWVLADAAVSRTLEVACPVVRVPANGAGSFLVFDTPDSVGKLWGASFPAYIFRNGLADALALCSGRKGDDVELEFLRTADAAAYNLKPARRMSVEEAAKRWPDRSVLRFSLEDPRAVTISAPLR